MRKNLQIYFIVISKLVQNSMFLWGKYYLTLYKFYLL